MQPIWWRQNQYQEEFLQFDETEVSLISLLYLLCARKGHFLQRKGHFLQREDCTLVTWYGWFTHLAQEGV